MTRKLRLGIFPNMNIEKVRDHLADAMDLCDRYGIEAVLPEKLARQYGVDVHETGDGNLDAAVSLGGDGTFLRMAREVLHQGIPVFGVNFGHLGFLAEVEYRGMAHALSNLVERRFTYENRHLLEASVCHQDGREETSPLAINEFVLARGNLSTINHMELVINGKRSGVYAADGLIVSTATGSTAYSLSAGGPLVQPGLDVMIITPICAHSLTSRPLIIPATEEIQLQIKPPSITMELAADGNKMACLKAGDHVTITRSDKVLKLVRLTSRSYYETWQEKLIRNI